MVNITAAVKVILLDSPILPVYKYTTIPVMIVANTLQDIVFKNGLLCESLAAV